MAFSNSDPDDAWRHFYQEYGEAMVAWQLLESELATLFAFLTKIPTAMAIQIFYASRSFQGRIDVYMGGVAAAAVPAEVKSFARALAKQAKKYAGYRNKFAHDQPLLRQRGMNFDILMVDGKGQFQSDDVKKQYTDEGVPVSEITYAAACFRQLANLTREFWIQFKSQGPSLRPQTAWLDILRERLAGLPTLPRKEALFPPSAVPKSPPAPSEA
jgi:hypothetical protein